MNLNTALELLLPQHSNASQIGNMKLNTFALELLLPQTHLVVRGSIHQRVFKLGTFQHETQHCVEATLASVTFRDQR